MMLSMRVRRVTTPAGDPAWLVTSCPDVKRLLNDPRLGPTHPDPDRAPRYMDGAIFGQPVGSPETGHAEHAPMRTLLTRRGKTLPLFRLVPKYPGSVARSRFTRGYVSAPKPAGRAKLPSSAGPNGRTSTTASRLSGP